MKFPPGPLTCLVAENLGDKFKKTIKLANLRIMITIEENKSKKKKKVKQKSTMTLKPRKKICGHRWSHWLTDKKKIISQRFCLSCWKTEVRREK